MNYGIDDDELISAANEIPDLQVSELQKEGNYLLPRIQSQSNIQYYQQKNKFQSLYQIKACLNQFKFAMSKQSKISTSSAFYRWKTCCRVHEFFIKNHNIAIKVSKAFKSCINFQSFIKRKLLSKWKIFVHKAVVLENSRKTEKKLAFTIEAKLKHIQDMSEEIKEYSRVVASLQEKEKTIKEKIAGIKESEDQKASEELLRKVKVLRNLLRENEEICEKMEQAEQVYWGFISSMNSLVMN